MKQNAISDLSGGLVLQPLTPAHTAYLDKINSPIIHAVRIMGEVFSARALPGQKLTFQERVLCVRDRFEKEIVVDDLKKLKTIFICTQSQERLDGLWRRGQAAFETAVKKEFEGKLHVGHIERIFLRCVGHYLKSCTARALKGAVR